MRSLDITEVLIQPVPAGRARPFAGHDFHNITVMQFGIQWNQFAVHLGANAAVPQVGMDPESKIQWRRALRQVFHIPFRRIDKNLVAEYIRSYRFQEFFRPA